MGYDDIIADIMAAGDFEIEDDPATPEELQAMLDAMSAAAGKVSRGTQLRDALRQMLGAGFDELQARRRRIKEADTEPPSLPDLG